MKDNDKVTLTFGQLKRLIKESDEESLIKRMQRSLLALAMKDHNIDRKDALSYLRKIYPNATEEDYRRAIDED